MRLVSLHKMLCYALLVLPFAVLWLGGEMNPFVSAAFVVGMAVSWFWEAPRVDVDRWARLLVLATFAVFAGTVFRVIESGSIDIGPFVDLVLLLTVIKAMQRRHPGDYAQLLALSFLLMTAASAYHQGLLFALAFVVYLIAGTIALAVKHLREELTTHHPAELSRYRPEGAVLATVAGLALVVFVFSLAFFLAFPRMGFGLFNTTGRGGLMTSGFSESVSLGQHGSVRDDDTVVMRVRFPDGPPTDDLRWRGTSFDTYDGRRWLRRSGRRDSAFVLDSGHYVNPRVRWSPTDGAIVQDIYLEPLDSDVLFGLPQVIAIDFPDEDEDLDRSFFREYVRVTMRGEFFLDRRSTTGVHYRAYSQPQGVGSASARWPGGATDLRDAVFDSDMGERAAEVLSTYLQLPDTLTPRFAQLATRIVEGAETPYEMAVAIVDHLQSSYDYTLDLPEVDRDNPIESFLFDTRRGHCEYFATAMALLAREVGLPVRNVNGFLGGDWNGIGGFFAVRQSHAHSWVEVLLPDAGWVTFDPTPAVGLPAGDEGGFWASLAAFFDSIRMLWYRYVVDYDLEDQLGAVRAVVGLFGEGENLAVDLRSIAFALFRNMGVMVVGLMLWFWQLWFYTRRQRNDRRWSRLDTSVGLGTLALVELLVWLLWRPEPTLRAYASGAVLPALTWLVAWAVRRGGERIEATSRRGRRRRLSRPSRIYLKLVQTMTRSGYDHRVGDVPSTLVEQARRRGAGYTDELRSVIGVYQRCRFGGEPSRDEVAALQRRARLLRRHVRQEARAS